MARRKPRPAPAGATVRGGTYGTAGAANVDGAGKAANRLAITGAILIVASQWLVDSRAEAAFDAPKRLVTLTGGVAALALVGPRVVGEGAVLALRAARSWARAALGFALAALAWALVAALACARTAVALDAWRTIALSAVLLAIGASRALDGRGERILLGAFWVTSAVTALVSLAQRLGGLALFEVEQLGGRAQGIAAIGNEGLVGLVMALAATTAAAVLWSPRARDRSRRAATAMLGLALAALAASANLTGWLAVGAGIGIVALVNFGRRAAAWGAGAFSALVVIALLVPPLAHRGGEAIRAVERGDWNGALTYRPIAWRTALEMVCAEPWTGNGPGTFEADFVPFRLAAELRARERLANPGLVGHFAAAHDEYLEAFAATGLPGGLLTLAAVGALLAGSGLRATRRGGGLDADAQRDRLAFATLACGAVAALTWFPLQAAATRVPLLLVAGRAWRGLGESGCRTGDGRPRGARAIGLATLAALALLAIPELPRYAAEHVTYAARARAGSLLAPGAPSPSPALVARLGADAASAARWLPGDSRALTASAAAALVARDGVLALARYRLAAAQGERAEIDLNLGRAYAILDRRPEALAAFVRAIWLAPVLASELPEAAKPLVEAEIAHHESALASGAADALPPLPAAEAP